MNIRPEQLERQLQQELKPVYLVSGDEHLLVQEACDTIRAVASKAGFSEREIYQVEPKFNWDELIAAGNALSLFAEKKIIELRIPKGKPGDSGSKAFQSYCANPSESNLLLVITPKIDKSTQKTKWFKALDNAGAHVAIWPIEHQQLPQWIGRRLQQAGLLADSDAVKLLADLVDGNLLAAAQEIEKLKLLAADNKITADTIRQSVSDSSRYNVFNLVDTALKGEVGHTSKILSGLRGEGAEPINVIGVLSRELRQLSKMARAIGTGQSAQQVMSQHHVWRNRQPIVGNALSRMRVAELERLIQQMAAIDRTIKGVQPGNVWDLLESATLKLAGAKLPSSQLSISEF